MSVVGELVARLIAAGTPPEVAAAAVAEAFAAGVVSVEFRGHSADETAERRRAKDRDRKRLLRGIPQKSADIPQNSTSALTLSSSSKDSEHPKEKKEKKVRAQKIPLPPEWAPTDEHFAAAAKRGISREAVLAKTEDMRIWAASKDERRSLNGWNATLHGFLRRDAAQLSRKTHERPGQNPTHPFAGPAQTHGDAILTGMARYAERRFGDESPNGRGHVSGCADAACGTPADTGTASRDREPYRQLTLVAGKDGP